MSKLGLIGLCSLTFAQEFSWKEMLGEISDHSVRINSVPEFDAEIQVLYGLEGTADTLKSPVQSFKKGDVAEFLLENLNPSQAYFYRLNYRSPGSALWNQRPIYRFHTARRAGESFVFDIQADPHLDEATDSSTYATTQINIAGDRPDFLIDLGDTFLSEKYNKIQDTLHARIHLARSWYDHITHSIPLFLTIGNHEGELGWLNNGTDTCFAVRAAKERVKYYPNPKPNGFFSGDTSITPFVGQRESWYSWNWGDALFVVIDPYWNAKKDKTQESGWGFTLGEAQYNWLKQTLRQSSAKYKFVFAHQLVGGDEPFVSGKTQGTGRGGAKWAHLYEMGGYNKDSTYVWDQLRPGWEKPLHNLFVETGVNIYFHGHDHLFSMEEKDGVIYQECPQPGLAQFSTAGNADVYGYQSNIIPNAGHMRISLNGDSAQVEYVRAFDAAHQDASKNWLNGQVAFRYSLSSHGSAQTPTFTPRAPLALFAQVQKSGAELSYQLSAAGPVQLTVMDYEGRVMQRIVNQTMSPGTHQIHWQSPASGEYFVLLNAQGQVKTTQFFIP